MADRYVIHGPLPSALREVKSKRTRFLVARLMCLQYLSDVGCAGTRYQHGKAGRGNQHKTKSLD